MDPTTLVLIALMIAAFYFLIMRPQRKRQQAIQKTLNALSTGTRVMLGSGIFGTVIGVGQKQVVVEISEGTELTVLKQAIAKVVTDDDEDSEYEVHEDLDDEAPADAAPTEFGSTEYGSYGETSFERPTASDPETPTDTDPKRPNPS